MSETTTVLDALAMTADDHLAAAENPRGDASPATVTAVAAIATAHATIAQAMRSER
jgi:hypothetical protein